MFFKKISRYCHSPIVVQKLLHFLIYLYFIETHLLFTIERGTHTSRAGNPQNLFDIVIPLVSSPEQSSGKGIALHLAVALALV